jgi:type II secretory pathway pseudopilin PulG
MSKVVNRKSKRGFNLIEAAIVLGVVGLVIGGIWVAAAAVQQNLREADASKGLIQIVQNVRNLYYGQTPTATATITTDLIASNAIPANFVSNSTTAVNPWNGSVAVRITGASFDQIQIDYVSVPKSSCISLVSKNTNISTGTGLASIIIDATTGGTDATVTTFPLTPTTAATNCGTTNTITWQFGLRG